MAKNNGERSADIFVLGYFGFRTNRLNGQTVRTRSIHQLLELKNNSKVSYYDTEDFKTNKLTLFVAIANILKRKTLVFVPAQNSFKYFFPFIFLLCKTFQVRIVLIAVGGWLPDLLKGKRIHAFLLSKISCVFTQSSSMHEQIASNYNLKNVETLHNFRIHNSTPQFSYNSNWTLKIVFFARIMKEKGVDVVFRLAEHLERNNYTDQISIAFYGPIEPGFNIYFYNRISKHKNITYKGVLQPEDVYSTLCKYDLLVLPTSYQGEGFPGSILDAFISGVPVIVSNWMFLPEFVNNGENGFVFDLKREHKLYEHVITLLKDRDLLLKMKKSAYESSKLYSSEKAWSIISKHI